MSHLWLRRNYLQGRCYLKGRPPQKTESLFSQCFYLFHFMGFFLSFLILVVTQLFSASSIRHIPHLPTVEQ